MFFDEITNSTYTSGSTQNYATKLMCFLFTGLLFYACWDTSSENTGLRQ
jgi:hypothetical protein